MFEANVNAVKLGEAVGISGSAICDYLREETQPFYGNLIKLADYFNCTTDFLLGLEEENYTRAFKKCPPFGERIKTVLKECGKSQYRVEKDCNIPHSTFCFWKSGTTLPTVDSLIKLSNYLGRTVDYIIGRSN